MPDLQSFSSVPGERVQEWLKLQKAAQKISSILDLDQLIDKIVNEIACSFGCVEINVYLHEPENSEMVLAGVRGCSVHKKDIALKIGKEGMVGYVAATGQMRYAPDVTVDPYYIACEKHTVPRLRSRCRWTASWSVSLQLRIGARRLRRGATVAAAGFVQPHWSSGSECAIVPAGTMRARENDPRSTGSALHPTGPAAQEFTVHSGFRGFRRIDSGGRDGRRLVRLHRPAGRALGPGAWRTYQEKERRRRS